MATGLKYALSKNMVFVSFETPLSLPPKTPAIHIGWLFPSLIIISEPFKVLSIPSSVVNLVPASFTPTFTFLQKFYPHQKHVKADQDRVKYNW